MFGKRKEVKPKYMKSGVWQLHVMVMIPMILIAIFYYMPMAGLAIAFEDFVPSKGIFGSDWVGFENFRFIFKMPGFRKALLNTLKIASLKILVGFPVPIIIALLLNEVRKKYFKKSVQTIVYLPYFLSWAVLSGIILEMFSRNGIVNTMIGHLGIDSINWLGANVPFVTLLVFSDIWKSFGFNTVVYMASLSNINGELYEAAMIDGANRWKQTIHITLPGILPIAMLLAILSLGNILNAGFEQIFTLYSFPVYESSDIIDTLVYRLGIANPQYGFATAVGFFKSVVSLILIVTANYLAYKHTDYRVF